ncbi:MAG: hypothetical protein R6U38_14065 [Desulfatiglandaceae bacterium]
MQEMISPKKLPDPVREELAKFDLNACFTCGTCTNGCPITGSPGMEGLDTRKVIRMLALGLLDEVVAGNRGCSEGEGGCTGMPGLNPLRTGSVGLGSVGAVSQHSIKCDQRILIDGDFVGEGLSRSEAFYP